MTTTKHQQLIASINHIAHRTPKREGELDRPLEWNAERGIWEGFFLNYDDGRGIFFIALKRAGWEIDAYHASYHWAVKKDGLRLEYVEGDLYAKPIEA